LKNIQKKQARLLGINYEQLKQIIDYGLLLEEKIQESEQKNQVNLIRGRKTKITKEDQIIMTLIYLRQHLTFQILGLLFEISESTAHERFNYWQKILRKALPSSLIEQGEEEGNLEDIIKKLSEEILLIDSEEQPIERYSDYETQKKCYSGKKKQHTFKNQIISRKNAEDLVDVVAGEPGPKSDIKICRENLYKLAKEQKMIGDTRLYRRRTNYDTTKEAKK
jgi:Helix-turn-helix of DDE superfamily endonuclease/DDE superfamily endonuclease